jgi:hypothetical protein
VIAASGYEARLEFAPEDPEAASYELTVSVKDLVVDDAEIKERLAPRLEELGVRDRPFSRVSDADRAKIRASMLDEDQLDAGRFPTISAEAVVAGRREADTDGGVPFPYSVRLNLEIRGRKVAHEAVARYEYREGRLYVESLASFRFKEFGIRPYSAFLGAVRNRDLFHVYVRIVAVAEGDESGGTGRGPADRGGAVLRPPRRGAPPVPGEEPRRLAQCPRAPALDVAGLIEGTSLKLCFMDW